MKPRFKFFSGDCNWQDYGGKFISQKFNNCDWDYWLLIEVINLEDACGMDATEKYAVSLMAVSPQAAGRKGLEDAFNCCGYELSEENLKNEMLCIEALSSYGIQAQLESISGNNLSKLLREIRKKAQIDNFLFGFAMDRQENAIGNTGWDFISGNIGFKTTES